MHPDKIRMYTIIGIVLLVLGLLIAVVQVHADEAITTNPYTMSKLESSQVETETYKLGMLQARRESLQNQMATVTAQQQLVQIEFDSLLADIKKAHSWGPEAVYNRQSLQFEYNEKLVEKPVHK